MVSDDTHQYHWKISRNSENVSVFVKCILPAKSVTREEVVPGSFPVNMNLNSLLVKRQIDNPSPGAVTGGN